MFNNGSIKDNLNFKTICPLKQREKTTKITYQNNLQNLYIYPSSGLLEMEEFRYSSISRALQKVGGYTSICASWEIYKLLFIIYNINPDWIEIAITTDLENLGKVFFLYQSISKFHFNMILSVDKRRGYQKCMLYYAIKH